MLLAVFFTALLVTGTAMSQTFRERMPQLATLKAIGFSDGQVSAIVVWEAVLLCLFGAGLGLAGAALLIPSVNAVLEVWIGRVELGAGVVASGVGLALAAGLAISFRPAWAAMRLSIVAGLRGN